MFLLLFDKYTLKTSKNLSEIMRKVKYHTSDNKISYALNGDICFFEGWVGKSSFGISKKPLIRSRKLWLPPHIRGIVKEDDIGCNVYIRMRANLISIIFTVIWISFCLYGLITSIVDWFYSNGYFENIVMLLVLMLCSYIFAMIPYLILSRQSLKKLHQIIDD